MPTNDAVFRSRAVSQTGSATVFRAVVPNDDADLPGGIARCLHVGGAGAVAVRDAAGNVATLTSGPGQYHPLCVARVLATGTTASGIVALY